ncbi:MAG: tyrosine-type recombinase/integrase [Acidobacteriota bacterium]
MPPPDRDLVIKNAVALWSDATTGTISSRRDDILRDKRKAVLDFFNFARRHPAEIRPEEVKDWQKVMEESGLAGTTIYSRICHLSSFYSWALRDPMLSQVVKFNPVTLAHPKAPKPYQTRSVKSRSDDELRALLKVVKEKADVGSLIGKRDYALLLFYLATGLRRSEVISLRGRDVELLPETMIIGSRLKGGDYQGREVSDPAVREALLDYLSEGRRLSVIKNDGPLWTRHDRAGRPGGALSSHSFVENLKRYARKAGIGEIHLHQLRHSFARIVAELSGSLGEIQEALGHKHAATTRIYVQRIAIKRDKFSSRVLRKLGPVENHAESAKTNSTE